MMGTFSTLADLLAWCSKAPPSASISVHDLGEVLEQLDSSQPPARPVGSAPVEPASWQERLWTVPAETRMGAAEVAEALGRVKGWVYARTGPKAADPLPHRKLDGVLTFTAGEIRTWIRDREEVVHALPMTSTGPEKRRRLVASR